jgi:hypothetical protein
VFSAQLSALVTAVMLFSCSCCFSFDNIEADVAYERQIKEQIRKEFSAGIEMLKAQAERLGMAVREKDVTALKLHMYSKAFMMGRCVDKAMTIKKTISGNILIDKYVKGCIDAHIRFMSNLPQNLPIDCRFTKSRLGAVNEPYDFLGIDSTFHLTDYVGMRDCYEKCQPRSGQIAPAYCGLTSPY